VSRRVYQSSVGRSQPTELPFRHCLQLSLVKDSPPAEGYLRPARIFRAFVASCEIPKTAPRRKALGVGSRGIISNPATIPTLHGEADGGFFLAGCFPGLSYLAPS
jgi:hypothetical protein